MKRKVLPFLLVISILLFQQSFAQVSITVKSTAAYTAFYKVSYTANGTNTTMQEKTIYAGGNQAVSVPSGASNITIKTRFKSVFSDYDLTTVNAGRSGGTFTFKGLLGGTDFSWEPDDAVSGVGEQNFADINKIYPNGDTELHQRARDKNTTQMQILIDKGISHVNTKNQRGLTPLHECVQNDFGAGIDILLKAGANMNTENNNGENAFLFAINMGKKEMIDKFISQGYPAATDNKAMETAIKKRNENMVKLLLDNGADATAAVNTSIQQNNMGIVEMVMMNYTPTLTIEHYKKAVDARRIDVAKKILELNIDANEALDYAIAKNTPDLVDKAMEKGGDPQKVLKYGLAQRKPDLVASAVTNYKADPNLALEEAIKSNQNDIVTLLMDNNADADAGLTYAINNNKTNYIQLMLDKGAKVSNQQISAIAAKGDNVLLPKLIQAGGDKNIALGAAMGAKKYQTAEMIIQAGATPDNIVKIAVENNQKSLLIAALDANANPEPGLIPALLAGKKDYAELLFKAGAKTSDPESIKAVITKGDLSILKLLIDNQTDVNTAFPIAVTLNNNTAVQMLLDNNADAKPPQLINTAIKNNNLQIVELLIKSGADAKPAALIATATATKNLQLVEVLIKAGASPDNGIMNAVLANDVQITKVLLNAGASGKNSQLLNASVGMNNAELTTLLLDAGAEPNDALATAVAKSANNVLSLLISKGVNVKNSTYVSTAIKNNNVTVLALLISAGNDMEYKDAAGNNYLHLAASNEADKVVTALATAGVKVNDINNAKDAPIHIAVTQGRSEVDLVEAFLAAGADPNAVNGSGKKPLDITKGTRIKKRLKEAGGSKD